MSKDFERSFNKCIVKLEPYTVVDGIEYYYTISREENKTWQGWKLIDMYRDLSNFPELLYGYQQLNLYAMNFYRENYWNKLDLNDDLSLIQKTKILNTAIKYGVLTASKILEDTIYTLDFLDDKYKDEYWFIKIYDLYEGQVLLKLIKSIPKKNLEILLENFI